MRNFKFLKLVSLILLGGLFFMSCSDDDDDDDQTKVRFVITAGDAQQDLKGGNSLLIVDDLSTLKDISVYKNADALYTKDAFTQVSYNPQSKVFTGYIYGRGAVELGSAGLRSYEVVDNKLQKLGEPVKLKNFGNTGTFGAYSYAAAISNATVMVVSRSNATITGNDKLVNLEKFAIDKTTPSITGVVDRGNNQLAVALYYANRDSAAVALTDYNLNISDVIYDKRVGASYGAWRSVRYSQIGIDGNSNVYVFSGNGKNGVGAVKIAKGTNTFDKNYLFDILAASDGYHFRKVFHISDDYFLLEFYYDKDKHENMAASGKFAVVKMSDKSFKWVTGLPTRENIKSIAWPGAAAGAIYLPINLTAGKPTVYAIDAKTAVATPKLTLGETELLKAVTIINE